MRPKSSSGEINLAQQLGVCCSAVYCYLGARGDTSHPHPLSLEPPRRAKAVFCLVATKLDRSWMFFILLSKSWDTTSRGNSLVGTRGREAEGLRRRSVEILSFRGV